MIHLIDVDLFALLPWQTDTMSAISVGSLITSNSVLLLLKLVDFGHQCALSRIAPCSRVLTLIPVQEKRARSGTLQTDKGGQSVLASLPTELFTLIKDAGQFARTAKVNLYDNFFSNLVYSPEVGISICIPPYLCASFEKCSLLASVTSLLRSSWKIGVWSFC